MERVTIQNIRAYQVLNSRGMPTVKVEIVTKDGAFYGISPSGASRGRREARELYDGDKKFGGKSIELVARRFNRVMKKKLIGMDCTDQENVDSLLRSLMMEGKIGANFAIATSIACCRAGASALKLEIHRYVRKLAEASMKKKGKCIPIFNMLNSGAHVGAKDDIQEHMIIPSRFNNVKRAIFAAAEIYFELKNRIKERYSLLHTLLGDEGGFYIPAKRIEERLDLLMDCAETAGYSSSIELGLDAAASQFYQSSSYTLLGKKISRERLAEYYLKLSELYPLRYLEDGMAEDDVEGWQLLGSKLGDNVLVVGDDLTVTNPELIKKYHGILGGVIIKPNQIGTVSHTIQAVKVAREKKLNVVVSHRSGDSEDVFIADFAVGISADFCKFGAPARAERTAKYNRLIELLD